MALLLAPATRVIDATGAAVSGGKVRVYNANTTTLSSLYSDAALTVPLTNPVTCNSTGYPSSNGTDPTLIYCAAANYDVAFLSAASAVLRSWDDVPSYGSDEATLLKDFTNSRFQVRGSGGTVYVEAGDASPDNTGGTGRLGGWAGTQADSWTVDAASANIGTSVGALKENSKKLQGVVATEATTLSAATTNIIPLPNSPSGCRAWRVDFFDMTSSAGGAITMTLQLSFDNGATYKSTNEYDGWMWGRDTATTGVLESVQNAAASGQFAVGHSKTNKLMWGTLEILSPLSGSSSDATIVRGDVSAGYTVEGTNRVARYLSQIYCQSASQGRPTHVKILASSGNIDCKYRVVPLRGYGE